MSTEQVFAPERTRQIEAPSQADDLDPLAKITLTRRGFAAVMATAALLVGLALALLPIRVAAPDPTGSASVTCGNTIGGVESNLVIGGLGDAADQPTRVAYVDMCERAVSNRTFYAWPMFFAGMIGIVWLGVVRQRAPTA